jgi:mono/diheme cytochrome c family protein
MKIRGFLAAAVAIVAAVRMADGGGGTTPPVSFEADVQPIFDENCVACHQSNGAPHGLVLEDGKAWRDLLQGHSEESKLALVAPGKSEQSYLFIKIAGTQTGKGSGTQMPPGDPLSPDRIAIVQRWIDAGAPNN